MSIQSKLCTAVGLLLVTVLVAACGAQPGQVAPNRQSMQAAAEGQLQSGDKGEADEHGPQEDVEFAAVALVQGETLKVVATTNIVADLVHNVGGDKITLTSMLPVGVDPHTFAPTPQDAAAVAKAHVVFENGLHLEAFLKELIENAGGNAAVVAVATHVDTRQLVETAESSPDHEDDHSGVDPHIWMTPHNAIIMVHNIEQTLRTLDPANAATYKANAAAYKAQLQELDRWITSQIDTIPAENREIVTDHDALGYYANQYGLNVVGAVIPNYSTNAESSAQELAALQKAIEAFDTKAIFVGTTVNPTLAQRMADDTGMKLIPLYTGSLGAAGSGAENYLDFMRYNTTALVEALK